MFWQVRCLSLPLNFTREILANHLHLHLRPALKMTRKKGVCLGTQMLGSTWSYCCCYLLMPVARAVPDPAVGEAPGSSVLHSAPFI